MEGSKLNNFFAHETSIIDNDCNIGRGTKIWHFSHIMQKSSIGKNCNIGQNVVISPEVVLGSNVKVQNNVSIYTGVTCEDDVFVGPSVVFTNIINPRSQIVRKGSYESTLVKRGASIGANATIICGTTIGIFAMVGAGSVITKNVKNYALVVGNPGKQIGWISEYGNNLKFNNDGTALCTETKEKYILKNNEVIKLT
ncbi:MAG: N-acetyltransferase [Flavobacteriaceae bacterium]|mgnify:CR=1 FL=1|jgi:UDP-2-acetamido-3-amino-2,3-dideoxy-glucuronate N-acetyltransferase|nr:N-acetyltransferase [Flavobacteriaceae bacterium]MBT6169116.1 N-acetyltransferase [Flavobacteriaceae bacterium]MBT6447790.1 N-acetyltransferase [Flavobacteriaceae bacterium]